MNNATPHTAQRIVVRLIVRNSKGVIDQVLEQEILSARPNIGLLLRRAPFREAVADALQSNGTATFEVQKWSAAMCHSWQNAEIAKQTLFWKLAERIEFFQAQRSDTRDSIDAARYRWLRENNEEHCDDSLPYVSVHVQNSWGKWVNDCIDGEALDAEIDRALKNAAPQPTEVANLVQSGTGNREDSAAVAAPQNNVATTGKGE